MLDQALNTSEKLGIRLQTALIHFELGNLQKQKGDATGAGAEYRQASGITRRDQEGTRRREGVAAGGFEDGVREVQAGFRGGVNAYAT